MRNQTAISRQQVYSAQEDMIKADRLIRQYLPFIRSQTAQFTGHRCTGNEDEYSIAMIAFHEAIRSYSHSRGAFLSYAALVIRSRLTDWRRKEARHTGHISIYEETGDTGVPLHTTIADSRDEHGKRATVAATKEEIAELSAVMAEFGLSFTDVAENSPRQRRTMESCRSIISYAQENPQILEVLLKTGKLPVARLVQATSVERKTIERHRKYILAMLLILTNGYDIIRGHLRRILKPQGGVSQ